MDPEARELEPGLRARAVTPSLWSRTSLASFGGWEASWMETELSEALDVTRWRPSASHRIEQSAGDPVPLCASRSFSDRFMTTLFLQVVLFG